MGAARRLRTRSHRRSHRRWNGHRGSDGWVHRSSVTITAAADSTPLSIADPRRRPLPAPDRYRPLPTLSRPTADRCRPLPTAGRPQDDRHGEYGTNLLTTACTTAGTTSTDRQYDRRDDRRRSQTTTGTTAPLEHASQMEWAPNGADRADRNGHAR